MNPTAYALSPPLEALSAYSLLRTPSPPRGYGRLVFDAVADRPVLSVPPSIQNEQSAAASAFSGAVVSARHDEPALSAQASAAPSFELRDEFEHILDTENVELAFELFLLRDDPSDKELLVGETIDRRDDDIIDLAYEESKQSPSTQLSQHRTQLYDAIEPRASPASAEPTQIQVSMEELLGSEVDQANPDARHHSQPLRRPRVSGDSHRGQSREAT